MTKSILQKAYKLYYYIFISPIQLNAYQNEMNPVLLIPLHIKLWLYKSVVLNQGTVVCHRLPPSAHKIVKQ